MSVMMNATLRLAAIAATLVGGVVHAQHAPHTSGSHTAAQPIQLFATVNGRQISAAEFDATAREAYRRKFYHGKPPEAEVNQMLRQVGQDMIDQILLDAEVVRQKTEPNRAAVEAELATYDLRYKGNPQWEAQRDETLPRIRAFLEGKSRLSELEAKVRKVAPPSAPVLRAYYDKNKDLFTEPEKIHVAVITFGVDPSSPSSRWDATRAEAIATREEILGGADFAEIARLRSTDKSRDLGGDLGYLHRGMLSEEVHTAVDQMKAGDVSQPIRALEGYVLVKLVERLPARLRAFADVETRARDLWLREASELAWKNFLIKIRSEANIVIAPEFKELMAATEAK